MDDDDTGAARPAVAGLRPGRHLLIETKMQAPRLLPRCVVRPLALAELRRGLEHRLTVVTAPAGFGKTTLVAAGCRALADEGAALAWISFEEDDDELGRLCGYVVNALSRAAGELARQSARLLAEDPLAPADVVLSVLLNDVAAFARPAILVLDDVDRLHSPAVREALFRLVRLAPDNLRFLLACRAEPPLALSYFRVRGQLALVDADSLRFDRAQAREFLAQVCGLPVSEDVARAVHDATEGWAAGLQLAGLSLRAGEGVQSASHHLLRTGREIDAYLAENVLPQVPPHIVDFLLATSVLDRLAPDLCDEVAGGTGARDILEWLEAHNLFIRRVDDAGTWYRCHALFRDCLARRLQRRGDAEVRGRHRAASGWYAAHASWPQAVRHALAAGDDAQAAAWVEACAMRLIEDSDAPTVLAWAARLPAMALAGHTRLRLACAWALAMTLRTDEVGPALDAVRGEIEALGIRLDDATRLELTAVHAFAAAALDDDSEEAVRLGTEILASNPVDGSWVGEIGQTILAYGLAYSARFEDVRRLLRAAPPFPQSWRPVHAQVYRRGVYGLASWLAGDLREAARLQEQALAYAESAAGPRSAAAVLPAGYLCLAVYEWNDLPRVAALLQDRLDVARETSSLTAVTALFLAAARLGALRGELESARRWLSQGRELAARRRWMRMDAHLGAELIRLELQAGRVAQAQQALHELEAMLPSNAPVGRCAHAEAWHIVRFARARLQIATGSAADAAHRLEDEAAELETAGLLYRAARCRILAAVGHATVGAAPLALRTMATALLYGEPQGLLRSFADEGAAARVILSGLLRAPPAGVSVRYLTEVLAAFDVAEGAGPPEVDPATTASRLSAREIEILDFIAQGLSNKEIARALRVAPETIKWHLKNIFEKLSVSTRAQAVQCGLGLDLPTLQAPRT